MEIEATQVLKKTIQAEKDYKIICHEGGSRSSKTWSIIQFFLLKALQGESITITVVRSNLTWIKATILKDFEEILKKYNIPVSPEINGNRAEQVYKIYNAEIAFFGLDYAEKLHGRKQDWTWLNEVMEVRKKEFDQLEMRTTKGMIIDYNPSDDSHWVFELQKRPDVCVIKSTMLDNPFLPESIINKIKSYEPTEVNIRNGTADAYMWEVYGKGNKARLQGAIYTNWEIIESVPENALLIGLGLDFGYSNDETALVEMYMLDNEIIFNELIYEKGLTNQDIASRLKLLNVGISEIYGDSSEPKSIEEIFRQGFNIRAVDKGADSINFGINLLKSYKVKYTRKSVNLDNEVRKYKWAEDRSGRSLSKPVDVNNHLLDACRYIAMMKLRTSFDFQFISNY